MSTVCRNRRHFLCAQNVINLAVASTQKPVVGSRSDAQTASNHHLPVEIEALLRTSNVKTVLADVEVGGPEDFLPPYYQAPTATAF